jgi:hypothetical protein
MGKRRNYLLSYPRSGNTWVRYCIEFLAETPEAISDRNDAVLFKAHSINEKQFNNSFKKDRLILLIRNPIEVLTRGNMNRYKNPLTVRVDRFTHGLKVYDAWKSDKLLIYYEDVITKPKKSLKTILTFLEIDDKLLNGFMRDFKEHKRKGIEYYNQNVETSYTQGDAAKLTFHSSKADNKHIEFIGKKLKTKHKRLFNKYLLRYGLK